MQQLEVITWKWKPRPYYRSKFDANHVNVAARMVARHYNHPHRFTCITDDPEGIDSTIRVIPLWSDLAGLKNPSYFNGPSCYRRLKAFSKEAAVFIGPRFVSLDLDFVATGDLGPVWNRPEDFIIWGDTMLPKDRMGNAYNGSMWMMTAGARSQVWEKFDHLKSPMAARRAGCMGSDQGWITYCLGRGETKWTTDDGVYSYRKHIETNNGILPEGARIVFFHGLVDPWSPKAQRLDWVRQHWR